MAGNFEIGLVMAGAVSAGAYQAGVVDFLLEALEAWEERRGEPGVPRHRVTIKVLTGASAGGMTAALLASLAQRPVQAVRDGAPPAGTNPLWDAWVRRIDIRPLLDDADLDALEARARRRTDDEPRATLGALLNCDVLDRIAADVMTGPALRQRRAYFAEDLPLLLAVTNLRGVPYHIRFGGGPIDSTRDAARDGHGMVRHRDHLKFTLGEPRDGSIRLDAADTDGPAWKLVRTAALASGAFPGVLQSRDLGRAFDEYQRELHAVATDGRGGTCATATTIPPTVADPPDFWDFPAADGGVADNEPLELARQALAGPGGRNPRGCREAHRAVLMLDPFPEPPTVPGQGQVGSHALAVLGRLLGVFKNQSRFKLDELRYQYPGEVVPDGRAGSRSRPKT